MKRILHRIDEPQFMEWRSYHTVRHYDAVLESCDLCEQNQWLRDRGITINTEHVRFKRHSEPWIATTISVWLDDESWIEFRLVWA
jgi:hypothetical protein